MKELLIGELHFERFRLYLGTFITGNPFGFKCCYEMVQQKTDNYDPKNTISKAE